MPCPLCEFWKMLEEENDVDVVMDKWKIDTNGEEEVVMCEDCAKSVVEQVQTIEEESK
jgi:hypothetical protein